MFLNTKIADIGLYGIGYMKVSSSSNLAQIDTALIVGKTVNNS